MKLMMPELPATGKWLPPVPGLEFYHDSGYFYNEIPISYRVSEVIQTKAERDWFDKNRIGVFGEDKQVELLLAIERGTKTHEWFNHKVRGRSYDPTPYQDICDHLAANPIWENWEVVASEYSMVDPRRNIAGTCDLILRHKTERDRYAVADIKTKGCALGKSGKPIIPGQKNYSAQLGGYINLLNLTWPQLKVEDCFVIYVSELMSQIHKNRAGNNRYFWLDCLDTYEGCRKAFFREMEDI